MESVTLDYWQQSDENHTETDKSSMHAAAVASSCFAYRVRNEDASRDVLDLLLPPGGLQDRLANSVPNYLQS